MSSSPGYSSLYKRLTLTQNQDLLPSQNLELTPECQENEHIDAVPKKIDRNSSILSNLLVSKDKTSQQEFGGSKNDNDVSNTILTKTWTPEVDSLSNFGSERKKKKSTHFDAKMHKRRSCRAI